MAHAGSRDPSNGACPAAHTEGATNTVLDRGEMRARERGTWGLRDCTGGRMSHAVRTAEVASRAMGLCASACVQVDVRSKTGGEDPYRARHNFRTRPAGAVRRGCSPSVHEAGRGIRSKGMRGRTGWLHQHSPWIQRQWEGAGGSDCGFDGRHRDEGVRASRSKLAPPAPVYPT